MEDLDVSGRNFQRTIMAAISQAAKGAAKAILVCKYSRFGRNRMGNQLNLARLETAGGELVSATEEVDGKTAVGKFTFMTRTACAGRRRAATGGCSGPGRMMLSSVTSCGSGTCGCEKPG
ncbi:recombinase family protein [Nonomuraea sp. NPDC005692]|uniref:recombinase family protein n=1 Tax=Nonomuraea sp. NPDC005692 TaxID=3157168 RepID=UPI0033CAB1BC